MKFSVLLGALLASSQLLLADSLMLYNDSPFKSDVVVINALGKVIGQVTLEAQDQVTWYGDTPSYNALNSPTTPYTVIWYCQDGTEYGIWVNIPPGAMATAQLSSGQKICKYKKPDKKEDEDDGISDRTTKSIY
jgi:surface antigen